MSNNAIQKEGRLNRGPGGPRRRGVHWHGRRRPGQTPVHKEDDSRPKWPQKVGAVSALIVGLAGAGVAFWVGKTTADVADETRRAQQFTAAVGQLADASVELQLGGAVSLGQLAETTGAGLVFELGEFGLLGRARRCGAPGDVGVGGRVPDGVDEEVVPAWAE